MVLCPCLLFLTVVYLSHLPIFVFSPVNQNSVVSGQQDSHLKKYREYNSNNFSD